MKVIWVNNRRLLFRSPNYRIYIYDSSEPRSSAHIEFSMCILPMCSEISALEAILANVRREFSQHFFHKVFAMCGMFSHLTLNAFIFNQVLFWLLVSINKWCGTILILYSRKQLIIQLRQFSRLFLMRNQQSMNVHLFILDRKSLSAYVWS